MTIFVGAGRAGYNVKQELVEHIKSLGHGVGTFDPGKSDDCRDWLCHDHYSAHEGVEHDDINVLVMSTALSIGSETALELADAFLSATFSNEKRRLRCLEKDKGIEQNEFC